MAGDVGYQGPESIFAPRHVFGEESLLDQKYYLGEARSSGAIVARIKKYRFIEVVKQDRKVLNEVISRYPFFHAQIPAADGAAPRRAS